MFEYIGGLKDLPIEVLAVAIICLIIIHFIRSKS
jgi:hypothetical protein